MKKYLKYLLVFGIILNQGLPAFSQDLLTVRSNTSGFNLGLSLGPQSWTSDAFMQLDEEEPRGLGGNLSVGYGFNQRLSVVGGFGYHQFGLNHDWDTFYLRYVDLGIRYNFRGTLQSFRPYLEAGVKNQVMEMSPIFDPYYDQYNYLKYTLKGTNLQVGAGFNYFFNPRFALNIYGKFSFGNFNTFLIDDFPTGTTPDVNTANIGLGISYFLSDF